MENPVNVEVNVRNGRLRGVVAQNVYGGEFLAFRGIPYAKPPVGQLRFKDPEPAEPWTGVKDASKFGDVCAHVDPITHKFIGSDDCLFLNVYTTSITGPRRPVMVWIHGGAFMYGSGNGFIYGPDYLIRKDVVVVTINYRIGILGFLNLEDAVAPGNQGLKDQVLALRWIKDNIANFGGDPGNVTIFGESAGGASVHYLTLSTMANGLFHKAISQSGVVANPWACLLDEPRRYAFQVAANLGQKSFDPAFVVDFLRNVDAKTLIKEQSRVLTDEEKLKSIFQFGPGIDNKSPNPFMPQDPWIAMQSGVKVPYLLGFNSNEGSFLLDFNVRNCYDKIDANFELIVHPTVMKILKRDGITPQDLRRLYFGEEPITKACETKYSDFLSDVNFIHGIHDVVRVQVEKGGPTYLYQFSYDSENSRIKTMFNITLPGVPHGEDIGFIFYAEMMKDFNVEPPPPGSEQYKVIEYFTEMWANFAKTGNPTPTTSDAIPTIWKPVGAGAEFRYLDISDKLEMVPGEKALSRCHWKKLKNKL